MASPPAYSTSIYSWNCPLFGRPTGGREETTTPPPPPADAVHGDEIGCGTAISSTGTGALCPPSA
jgi:hypothetical protein